MDKDDQWIFWSYVGLLAVSVILLGRKVDQMSKDVNTTRLKVEWLEIVARETEKS